MEKTYWYLSEEGTELVEVTLPLPITWRDQFRALPEGRLWHRLRKEDMRRLKAGKGVRQTYDRQQFNRTTDHVVVARSSRDFEVRATA